HLRAAGLLPDRLADRDRDERPGDPRQAQDRPRPRPARLLALALPAARYHPWRQEIPARGQEQGGRQCRHGDRRCRGMNNQSWWSWEHAAAVLPDLILEGFKITLIATVLGTLIPLVLGLVGASIRRGT